MKKIFLILIAICSLNLLAATECVPKKAKSTILGRGGMLPITAKNSGFLIEEIKKRAKVDAGTVLAELKQYYDYMKDFYRGEEKQLNDFTDVMNICLSEGKLRKSCDWYKSKNRISERIDRLKSESTLKGNLATKSLLETSDSLKVQVEIASISASTFFVNHRSVIEGFKKRDLGAVPIYVDINTLLKSCF